jgi:hypothetical protein
VTNCNLSWIEDKKEWKDTEVVWQISLAKDQTEVSMTHRGLRPGMECFSDCKRGWDFYVGKSLKKLFAKGTGLPDGAP